MVVPWGKQAFSLAQTIDSFGGGAIWFRFYCAAFTDPHLIANELQRETRGLRLCPGICYGRMRLLSPLPTPLPTPFFARYSDNTTSRRQFVVAESRLPFRKSCGEFVLDHCSLFGILFSRLLYCGGLLFVILTILGVFYLLMLMHKNYEYRERTTIWICNASES